MYPSPHSSHFTFGFAAFFLYSPHGIQFVLPNYSWEWSLSWHVVDLSGITPLKKTGSSFYCQFSNTSGSSSCAGTSSPSFLQAGVDFTWLEFVQVSCRVWAHVHNCPDVSGKHCLLGIIHHLSEYFEMFF